MQLSALDLNLLPVLRAILETGSVQRAAERVALSPSATSHALARLRDALGDPLLVRAGRQLVPTERGQRLADELGPLLDALEGTLEPTAEADPAILDRAFRIGCNDYAEYLFLRPLGVELAEFAPGVDLFSSNPVRRFDDELRAGRLDLTIAVNRASSQEYESRVLVRDEFVCALRPDHPALKRELTLDVYLELGHVLISPRGDPVGVVDELLGEMGKARRVARTVSNFLVAPAIVAKSDYIVTMSRGILAATDAPLVQLKPPFPLEGFEVSAKWHRRSEQDAALRWLVERLVAIGSQLQG